MKPIYEPRGAAKEYGDLAINIYTGCPHRCFYCYVPSVLRKDKEEFHSIVEPRKNIVDEVRKQLEREQIKDKLIHLCFTCDPYPTGYDSTPTREIIKLIKDSGNHVQILTKGSGRRDFDLLDSDDWYGVTIDGAENGYKLYERSMDLFLAKKAGANIWASFEPVIDPMKVIYCIKQSGKVFDKIKIGKLNYYDSSTNWKLFGHQIEDLCKEIGVDYYIKESLRKCMLAGETE